MEGTLIKFADDKLGGTVNTKKRITLKWAFEVIKIQRNTMESSTGQAESFHPGKRIQSPGERKQSGGGVGWGAEQGSLPANWTMSPKKESKHDFRVSFSKLGELNCPNFIYFAQTPPRGPSPGQGQSPRGRGGLLP